ncbi:DUF2309 domain-containing protein [Alicyclobacillus ferrooxydans]|uniref:DUF2309 domain-containing protein n=1 Tax=Alicyclobacillus ferrooxydans TaxID=471514 RepID=UPI0006D564F0|nr:DUF2309 domain-containing protein [Alicyclobacillus ferrooxydans]
MRDMNIKPELLSTHQDHFPRRFQLEQIVDRAVQAIAPLWPIDQFAARSPWMNLESEPFHRVAEHMKRSQGVDLYPSAAIIRAAQQKGEIEPRFVDARLQKWLDAEMGGDDLRETVEVFCRAVMSLQEIPGDLISNLAVQEAASSMLHLETSFSSKAEGEVQPLSQQFDRFSNRDTNHRLNHQAIKWCKLYLDESQAVWSLPYREEGFYAAWRQLVEHDPALPRAVRKRLHQWPADASSALQLALDKLQIPVSDVESYLREHLLALPGWAGMLYWRAQRADAERSLVLDYLAIRISMEWAYLAPYLPLKDESPAAPKFIQNGIAAWKHYAGMQPCEWLNLSPEGQIKRLSIAHRFNLLTARRLWLEAWEDTQSAQLQKLLTGESQTLTKPDFGTSRRLEIIEAESHIGDSERIVAPSAQFVFCIDVRSEPYRRRLERSGPFETYGAAGFFGLPVAVKSLGMSHAHASLPVILTPKHLIVEYAADEYHMPYLARRDAVDTVSHAFKTMKQSTLGSLLLPEVTGFWMALHMIARTFFPRMTGKAIRQLRQRWLKKPKTMFSIDIADQITGVPKGPVREDASDNAGPDTAHAKREESSLSLNSPLAVGIPDNLKVEYVRQFLASIGLTRDFAPIVVICGHGSETTNNPYAAKLDCGACGGASGAHNARILATLCNTTSVRASLKKIGIEIPEATLFLAAEHITTLDTLRWLYVPSLSEGAKDAFDQVNRVLPIVQRAAVTERLREFPLTPRQIEAPVRQAERLSEDWSEVRPEWGLAKNAAFVIGHRNLTKSCNLEGRVFLHSYDWQADSDGEILNAILSGPGTVAQWINLQYYASTVAPDYYGAGSKATQTVTSGLGVMEGNGSDLLTGVPWQSVMESDKEPYHTPLRLLIIVEAPRTRMADILEANPSFRQKVQNGWVRLATIDPSGLWEDWTGDAFVTDNGGHGFSEVSNNTGTTRPVFTS